MGVALPSSATVGELAERLGGEVDAPVRDSFVSRLCAADEAGGSGDLMVLTSRRYAKAVGSTAGPVLCNQELADRAPPGRRWVHGHVMWAVTQLVGNPAPYEREPARAARVHPEAEVAPGVHVASGAVVMRGARIGPDCELLENCVVYPRTELGARVVVGPLSVVGRPGFGWTPAPDGTLVRVAQLGGVIIGDDVEIGPLCTVDSGTLSPTRIGPGVKLDAHVHVGHNASVGGGTLVAGQAGFAGSVELGQHVLVGGQAGVADHVRVGDGARIAAHSGVIGDVPAGAVVAGFPAVGRVRWLRAWARVLGLADRRRP